MARIINLQESGPSEALLRQYLVPGKSVLIQNQWWTISKRDIDAGTITLKQSEWALKDGAKPQGDKAMKWTALTASVRAGKYGVKLGDTQHGPVQDKEKRAALRSKSGKSKAPGTPKAESLGAADVQVLLEGNGIDFHKLLRDDDTRETWVANIAMAIHDTKQSKGEPVHAWRQRCAERFLSYLAPKTTEARVVRVDSLQALAAAARRLPDAPHPGPHSAYAKLHVGTFGESLDIPPLDEVSPPGFKGTVKALKRKHPEIENPYALAWHMKNKGAKSNYKADGTRKDEDVAPMVLDLAPLPVDEASGKAKPNDPSVIAGLRKVVQHHQHQMVADATGKKTRMDVTTASVILTVYDALSVTNRAKYAQEPLPRMASMAFKMAGKNEDVAPTDVLDLAPQPLGEESADKVEVSDAHKSGLAYSVAEWMSQNRGRYVKPSEVMEGVNATSVAGVMSALASLTNSGKINFDQSLRSYVMESSADLADISAEIASWNAPEPVAESVILALGALGSAALGGFLGHLTVKLKRVVQALIKLHKDGKGTHAEKEWAKLSPTDRAAMEKLMKVQGIKLREGSGFQVGDVIPSAHPRVSTEVVRVSEEDGVPSVDLKLIVQDGEEHVASMFGVKLPKDLTELDVAPLPTEEAAHPSAGVMDEAQKGRGFGKRDGLYLFRPVPGGEVTYYVKRKGDVVVASPNQEASRVDYHKGLGGERSTVTDWDKTLVYGAKTTDVPAEYKKKLTAKLKMALAKHAARAAGPTIRVDGKQVGIGDAVGFKFDYERHGTITAIQGRNVTIAYEADGPEDEYNGGDYGPVTIRLQPGDLWLESEETDNVSPLAEGYQHVEWKGSKPLRFKVAMPKGKKTVQGRTFGKYIGLHMNNKTAEWTATHLPTGMAFARTEFGEKKLITRVKNLETRYGDELAFTDPSTVSPELKKAFVAVAKGLRESKEVTEVSDSSALTLAARKAGHKFVVLLPGNVPAFVPTRADAQEMLKVIKSGALMTVSDYSRMAKVMGETGGSFPEYASLGTQDDVYLVNNDAGLYWTGQAWTDNVTRAMHFDTVEQAAETEADIPADADEVLEFTNSATTGGFKGDPDPEGFSKGGPGGGPPLSSSKSLKGSKNTPHAPADAGDAKNAGGDVSETLTIGQDDLQRFMDVANALQLPDDTDLITVEGGYSVTLSGEHARAVHEALDAAPAS